MTAIARGTPQGRGAPGTSSGLALPAALLMCACAASLALGARPVPLRDVVDALFGFDGSPHDLVVRELRLPRTLVGVVVGAALGLAGALMQGLTRNPLADPGILGISAGAALGVVVSISFLGVNRVSAYVWFALGGAVGGAVIVHILASAGPAGATPVKLVLAGAALSALLASATTALLLLDEAAHDQFRFWAVGSVAGRDLHVLRAVLPLAALGAATGAACSRSLDTLALGEELARSLGQRVAAVRAAAAAAIVLLVAGAVAAAGPVGFVGLAVPHAARAIAGPDHRRLLPCSALLGAVLVVTADIAGRLIARPSEVQTGVVTALVGAPVFLALVRRARVASL